MHAMEASSYEKNRTVDILSSGKLHAITVLISLAVKKYSA
jgi:hypothetical protein